MECPYENNTRKSYPRGIPWNAPTRITLENHISEAFHGIPLQFSQFKICSTQRNTKMKTNNDMPLDARVWVYQSDRELTPQECENMQKLASDFVMGWTAHNKSLKAVAEIYYNRFLVLMLDEVQAAATGCSIDKSVKFIKEMELKFNINMLDRMNLAYKDGDKVLSCSRDEFEEKMKSGNIKETTVVFNNMVGTKEELESQWEIPLINSWHKNLV
jgi:hypothetical protein